jgi:outer membrane protein TolC
VAAAEARVGEQRARFLGSVQVGIAMERMERRPQGDRNWASETFYNSVQSGALTPPSLMPRDQQGTDVILGPTLGVELPLWDQNQAQIARAERVLQQAKQLREALLIDVAQDLHSRLARVRTAVANARFYHDEQLPAAERSANLSRQAYRAGQVSLLSILEAERGLLAARSGYLAALESAALAAIELERVTGQPAAVLRSLPPPAEAAAEPPAEKLAESEVQP